MRLSNLYMLLLCCFPSIGVSQSWNADQTNSGSAIEQFDFGGRPVESSSPLLKSVTLSGRIDQSWVEDEFFYYSLILANPLTITEDGKDVVINDVHLRGIVEKPEGGASAHENTEKEVTVRGDLWRKFDWHCLSKYVLVAEEIATNSAPQPSTRKAD